ncbi:MAG: TylF/MycF family methyltransferase, partial [Acidimicrobiia bacterium]|nr:TylF/MycF family methyltransferase [Acidimicrobiia bacterium]
DGLATIHNVDFMSSPRFLEAYAAGEATGSWHDSSLHWRTYICLWAAERGLGLEGDFVECGVNRGGYAAAISNYLDFASLDRKFYLLDTFSGIPTELVSEAEKSHGVLEYDYGDSFDAVQRTFAPYPNVQLVRGRIPDTLPQVPSDQIAFLSLDLNNVAPEIAAAEAFWPRLAPGAVVVLDDYGWERHIEQKRAFDKFAADHGVSVLPLPTGQGLMIKP